MAIMRPEGLGQLKNVMTQLGIKPATFQLFNILPQPTTLLCTPEQDGSTTCKKMIRPDTR
jgi:hypothetical protein